MNQRITSQLPPALLEVLRTGCPALLLTTGADGFPATAYTWALALDVVTLRFAADHGSATVANLERESRAALQIISPGNLIFLIKGVSAPVKPSIEAASFKMALMALSVHHWHGAGSRQHRRHQHSRRKEPAHHHPRRACIR
jgi:hypothetical protein